MQVFQTKWFARFVRKEGIADAALLQAVARAGQGRSGGYRTIVFFRQGGRAVFVYVFAKNARPNIDRVEAAAFRDAASHVLGLTGEQMGELVQRGDFVEVGRR